MRITKQVLTELGVSPANADRHLDRLNESMGQHEIDTPLRISHFLAQVAHESMLLKAVSENLNYSAEALLRVFGKYFSTREMASGYARQPERIANRVYANRMGNGPESSGDGFRYRGRGLVQLTGKNNYRTFSQWISTDCVADPDRVASAFAACSAVFYWDSNGLNALADTDNLKLITRRINGGLNGYDDRRNLLVKAKRALSRLAAGMGEQPTAPPPAPASVPAPVPARPPSSGPDADAPFDPTHRVVPRALRLRRTPNTGVRNRMGTLTRGTVVQQLGKTGKTGWARVRVLRGGRPRVGFVAARYLAPLVRADALAPGAGAPFAATHRVTAASLNLRSSPRVRPSTRIAVLAHDTPVEELGEAEISGWVMVRVMLNQVLREGFVAARWLARLPPEAAAFAIRTGQIGRVPIPPARLSAGNQTITRARGGGRLYPLTETGGPRVTGSTIETRVRQLLKVIAWLDCENPEHGRYRAKGRSTFAETYVCDYCELAGVFLPRVWWTADGLARIARGERVDAALGQNVRGLPINGLHDWLEDHGSAFGWHREIELIDLQAAANGGEVCLIVARHHDLNRAGRVVAAVPEHAGCLARRDREGDVVRPVESGCGARNRRCATARSAWWLSATYSSHGLWRNPGDEGD